MFEDANDLYQQMILDHSRNPKNFGKLATANRTAEGKNPLCGDQVTVYLQVENDVVKDIAFEGSGCAIFKSSASLMTTALKGKTKAEAQALFEKFHHLITHGEGNSEDLGKLSVFAGVNKFPARVKCATLPWHAVVATLNGDGTVVSTE